MSELFNFSLSIFKHQKTKKKYKYNMKMMIKKSIEILMHMFSRIYQHEYDHTLGITFVEKVSKLKFDMFQKKAEKMYKRDLQRSLEMLSQDRLDNLKKLI